MKLKTIVLTAVLANIAASATFAADIYITGATAFRAQVYTALDTVFDAGRTLNTDTPAAPSKANKRTWSGNIGGVPWTVYESYSGSIEGVQTLVDGTQNQFLPIGTGTTTSGHVCDIAFSDVYQETTPYNAVTLIDLGPVGVQPFVICKNANAANIDNVTSKQMQQLLASAKLPMSQFTGIAAQTSPVWLVGRYNLSGTRMSFHYDTDYVTENCNLAYDNGTTWEKKASPGNPEPGYTSGSGVATALGATKANYPAAIGYLSLGDAGTLPQVKYNGLAYSRDAVKNGQYSFWCYEHLYATASSQARGTAFFHEIWDTLNLVVLPASSGAIAIGEMAVTRDGDGAPVHPK